MSTRSPGWRERPEVPHQMERRLQVMGVHASPDQHRERSIIIIVVHIINVLFCVGNCNVSNNQFFMHFCGFKQNIV